MVFKNAPGGYCFSHDFNCDFDSDDILFIKFAALMGQSQ